MSPLLITGGPMWDLWFNSAQEFMNADGKDALNKLRNAGGEWVWDLFELTSDNTNPIYQVSPLAYAFASKVDSEFAGSAPKRIADDHFLYSMPSRFMPGLSYQMIERTACLDNRYETSHVAMELKGKFFLNPTSVNDANNTGIVKWYQNPAS
ncbi:MAG: hypothetical protein JNM00_09530 [Flavobacteriales bacterium]|nr:hypothetical protein [Flavobacteriales bacterium]